MIAIDTNVVVRFIALDDVQQSPRAKALIESSDVFVSLTVLLEAGWVLSSHHGYSKQQVVASLRGLLGLPRVSVDDATRVDRALRWVTDGLDFADALHLAQAEGLEAFATFDRGLVRIGSSLTEVPIRLL